MECALWLGRKKVFSAKDIADNLDIASLRGYFLAGSLIPWLETNGGADYAAELSRIPLDAPDLNDKIAAVFGSKKPKKAGFAFGAGACPAAVRGGGSSFSAGSFPSSFPKGSFTVGSFALVLGSFGAGSFGSYRGIGSYKGFGSGMHEWEWEWLVRRGSFSYGSGGSFRGLGSAGSFKGLGSGIAAELASGSYRGVPVCMSSDEYDRIMYETLAKCPLNRFGYGIHNI